MRATHCPPATVNWSALRKVASRTLPKRSFVIRRLSVKQKDCYTSRRHWHAPQCVRDADVPLAFKRPPQRESKKAVLFHAAAGGAGVQACWTPLRPPSPLPPSRGSAQTHATPANVLIESAFVGPTAAAASVRALLAGAEAEHLLMTMMGRRAAAGAHAARIARAGRPACIYRLGRGPS